MNGPDAIAIAPGIRLPRTRTYIVAIVNATPDSFSGDGSLDVERIVKTAAIALSEGADLLDVGAESTRPDATPLSPEEELDRLLPAVRAIREAFPAALLSIDTYKPEVFLAAAAAGGQILNLVRPLEPAHLAALKATDASVILTQPGVAVDAPLAAVFDGLAHSVAQARAAGIAFDRIIVDPGIGFGKTADQNVAILGALSRLNAGGTPSMLAASRKSILGRLTGKEVGDRAHATSATTAMAALARLDFVRVHDVGAAFDVARVCDAVTRGKYAYV